MADMLKGLRGATSEAEDETSAALQAFQALQEADEGLEFLDDAEVEAVAQAIQVLTRLADFAADLSNRLRDL